MSAEVAIIDSGGANIASLLCAFERQSLTATLTHDAETIRTARRVILPGVGAAADAMQRLRDYALLDVIRNLEQPVLGICLGMQLFADGSEEEDVECLGIIPGIAGRLEAQDDFPVPNMGWCSVSQQRDDSVFDDVGDREFFYFLHSYALPISKHTIASAAHARPFSAAVRHANFVAVQFHPERSSAAGARLLVNFIGAAE